MEHETQEILINHVEETLITTKQLSIRADNFQKMIEDSRPNGKTHSLNSKALNTCMAKELGSFEKETIKITHKASKINTVFDRADSKYFTAHGFCSQAIQCKVIYSFAVKHKPERTDYVLVNVDIKGINI